jgi:hypothetical protein
MKQMRVSRSFSRAVELCALFGVEFREESLPTGLAHYSTAPQHVAYITWERWGGPKTIWWEDEKRAIDACGLVHELTHAIHPVMPERACEYGQFLSVEYELRRMAGIPRYIGERWQADSIAVAGVRAREWRQLENDEQAALLRKSKALAVRAGRMTPEGRLVVRQHA